MPRVKRELSVSSETSESGGGSENASESVVAKKRIKSGKSNTKAPTTPPSSTTTNNNNNNKKSTSASWSPKARIPAEARRKIAQAIIHKGASSVDLEQLVSTTGLTRQQVRSQLIDNRQTVRKQLLDLAASLQ